jgi:hypothetical protein
MNVYEGENGVTMVVELTGTRDAGIVLHYKESAGGLVVKELRDAKNTPLKGHIGVGDLLVGVNGHNVTEEEVEDVDALLSMIKLTAEHHTRRMQFLNVSKCSIKYFRETQGSSSSVPRDKFGFRRSLHYIIAGKEKEKEQNKKSVLRDQEFVQYLKRIGGTHNLKPGGMFRCSPELKAVVRRGIPIAFKSVVWLEVSLANVHRRAFCDDYYQQCIDKATSDQSASMQHTLMEIGKDVDRTFPDHDFFRDGGGEEKLRRVLSVRITYYIILLLLPFLLVCDVHSLSLGILLPACIL